MGQRVETLADEVDTVDLSLVVELFKLDDELAKGKIGFLKAGNRNRALVDCPDAKDKLAEMSVVLVGEDAVEDPRAETVDVEKQLRRLVTT